MKFHLAFTAVLLAIAGCTSSNHAAIHKKLTGTWVNVIRSEQQVSMGSTTVDARGNFVCVWDLKSPGVQQTYSTWGTLQVTNGMLVETLTRHSDPNFTNLPAVSVCRVLRFDDRELVVTPEPGHGVDYPTNVIVFRKGK